MSVSGGPHRLVFFASPRARRSRSASAIRKGSFVDISSTTCDTGSRVPPATSVFPDVISREFGAPRIGLKHRRYIQVVLRLYEDVASVLASFDIDCCAVAYDGTKVHIAPRGLRALNSGCNLVDLSRRSLTYESRLLKYAFRGFSIGVPSHLFQPGRVSPTLYDQPTKFKGLLRGLRGLARLCVLDWLATKAATKQCPWATVCDVPREVVLESEQRPPLGANSSPIGPTAVVEPLRTPFSEIQIPCPLPNSAAAEYGGRNYTKRYLSEAAFRHEAAAEARGEELPIVHGEEDQALYGGGRELIPWRAGFDARRLKNHVVSLQQPVTMGEDGEEFIASSVPVAARSGLLPSEDLVDCGYDVRTLINVATIIRNKTRGSFFPVGAAGWSDGVHSAEPELLCRVAVLTTYCTSISAAFLLFVKELKRLGLLPASSPHSSNVHLFNKQGLVIADAAKAAPATELMRVLETNRRFLYALNAKEFFFEQITPLLIAAHPKLYSNDKSNWSKRHAVNTECERIWTGMRRRHRLAWVKVAGLMKHKIACQFDFFEWKPTNLRFVGTCAHCSALLQQRHSCSRCKSVMYCSRECQRASWPAHKKLCTPQSLSP